jgi:hypothetical protein
MEEKVNQKLLTFAEGLEEASKSKDIVQYLKDWMQKDKRVFNILAYAMNPGYQMGLPDGIPPYKKSDVPLGLAEVEILHLWNKMYILYSRDLPLYKKEEHFITWIEKMNSTEAEIFIAIKDKRLHKVFKSVSEYKIVEALGWKPEDYKAKKMQGK